VNLRVGIIDNCRTVMLWRQKLTIYWIWNGKLAIHLISMFI